MSKNRIKYTIKDMQLLARKKGGKCLSPDYLNSTTKLRWRCSEGHVWEAIPANIRNGRWCNTCARREIADRQRLTIGEMKAIARKKGGKCLSIQYTNKSTKLKWQCNLGHVWEATPGHVKQGTWCPVCKIELIKQKTRKYSIKAMREIATERGGTCLSKQYDGTDKKLKWQCDKGHIWDATPDNIIYRRSWCPYCSGNARLNIQEMRESAELRGGKCLSETYINSPTALKWQCSEGHVWEATPTYIRNGRWCPVCSAGLGERICRVYFETLFENKFPKCRPKWLLNEEGNQMELDGYCEALKLAFEHQGEQHYEADHIFHSNRRFSKRMRDDKRKESLCKAHNIFLIKVPEIPFLLKIKDLKTYILNECRRKGFTKFPKNINKIEVNAKEAYIAESTKYLALLRKIAKEKGGKCLSDYYIGNFVHLTFRCKNGHVWQATPGNIKRDRWCPYCAGKYQTIKDMQRIANGRGGKCLSKKYLGDNKKLKWQCEKGHTWETSAGTIKSGAWCPTCSGVRRLTIEEMDQIARQRGGECLSKIYINSWTKLKWQCVNGHIWEAIPGSIKRGIWCPHCVNKAEGVKSWNVN